MPVQAKASHSTSSLPSGGRIAKASPRPEHEAPPKRSAGQLCRTLPNRSAEEDFDGLEDLEGMSREALQDCAPKLLRMIKETEPELMHLRAHVSQQQADSSPRAF